MKTLFDEEKAEELKKEGLNRASSTRKDLLIAARSWARWIAERMGEVTIDEVQDMIYRKGMCSQDLGNAAGNVFSGKEWQFTGEWRKSSRSVSHGRMIRVWRLK